MRYLHRLSRRFATIDLNSTASQGTPNDRMESLLGESLAGCFRFPDVEILKMAVVHHSSDMDDQPFGWRFAEIIHDLAIDLNRDWHVL
jgi:hypothetical protein